MIKLLITLRSIVWSAIIAVLLGASAILSAVLQPENVAAPIALGLTALTFATLSSKNS
jgi:hypothetical protein